MTNPHETESVSTITSRQTRRFVTDINGSFTEIELAALSSVEVGQDAKGTAYVKSAKAYHADIQEAARKAVAAFLEAKRMLEGGAGQTRDVGAA